MTTEVFDFALSSHGTIAGIRPLNDAARDWLDENVHSEGWQWLGSMLCVDPIFAMNIVEGFVLDGFTAPGTLELVLR